MDLMEEYVKNLATDLKNNSNIFLFHRIFNLNPNEDIYENYRFVLMDVRNSLIATIIHINEGNISQPIDRLPFPDNIQHDILLKANRFVFHFLII